MDGCCVQQDPLFPEKQLKDELWNMKAVMPVIQWDRESTRFNSSAPGKEEVSP